MFTLIKLMKEIYLELDNTFKKHFFAHKLMALVYTPIVWTLTILDALLNLIFPMEEYK